MGVQYNTYASLAPQLLGVTPSLDHFKKMKKSEVNKFIEYFWNKATNNNTIRNQESANLMFQALWGSGPTGIKDMQFAMNKAYNMNLTEDGIVGPKTVAAINSKTKSPEVLYKALEDRYKRLAASPTYAQYLRGWLNRLEDLRPFMFAGSALIVAAAILFFTLR
jgi:lysozyme family protein